jgi:catechol 2,3-dioxygenase-like lactoylglutathione lyase family enzyme
VAQDRPTPFEFFNAAIEAFCRADLPNAVLLLRSGFFENLYIAPLLIGEEFYPQRIWHPSADAEPRAAEEYVKRYGRLWEAQPEALSLLRAVWNDSLVRAELRSYLSLSKNLLNSGSETQLSDMMRERELYLSSERLKRTQTEILARLGSAQLRVPEPRPRLGLVLLASRNPAASVEFYRQLLGVEPKMTSEHAGGYAEFSFEGVSLAIHGQDRTGAGDPYRLGAPPASLGWGAIFVFAVRELTQYYRNATAAALEIIDGDMGAPGRRFFLVKDPSGYLVELTEEDPRGLVVPS